VPLHLILTTRGKEFSQISYAPILQQYLDGHHEEANTAYYASYIKLLKGYNNTRRKEELLSDIWKSVEQKYREKNIDCHHDIFLNPDIVNEAIKEKIDPVFELIESIKAHGFIPDAIHPITGYKKGGKFYITNGYHRCTILRLLGYTAVPEIKVRLLGNLNDNPLYLFIRNLRNWITGRES
jgi:hypothetical protein